MKIQCDVCDQEEATAFCVADEAALCASCDHRVHHANKLAGKHHRFSLRHPSPNQSPLCDVCQERTALLFCQQDRAILCMDCDIPIHKANELTQKHSRFLLTGVQISASSDLLCSASAASAESASSSLTINNNASEASPVPENKPGKSQTTDPAACRTPSRAESRPESIGTPSTAKGTTAQSALESIEKSSGTISEYLMEMLPGWLVEDFLDSDPCPSLYGFSKKGENDLASISDGGANRSEFPTGFWVPQVDQNQLWQSGEVMGNGTTDGLKEQSKEILAINNSKSSMKRNGDNSFAVPQISARSNVSKRSRIL